MTRFKIFSIHHPNWPSWGACRTILQLGQPEQRAEVHILQCNAEPTYGNPWWFALIEIIISLSLKLFEKLDFRLSDLSWKLRINQLRPGSNNWIFENKTISINLIKNIFLFLRKESRSVNCAFYQKTNFNDLKILVKW